MFYRIALSKTTNDHGLITGSNRKEEPAQKAAERDMRSRYLSDVVVFESEESLEVGERYPEWADKLLAERRHNQGVVLMVDILECRASNGDIASLSSRIEYMDWTLEELEAECSEEAQAHIDAQAVHRQERAESLARVTATRDALEDQRAEYTYTFPAVSGIQAGRQFFTAQVPFKALVRLFTFDDEEQLPTELRAQRQLNETRAKNIGHYMLDNPYDYVLPALTASCSAAMSFEAVSVSGASNRLGLLHIPIDATLLINDGQHRQGGIRHALEQNAAQFRDETVSVTIFFDQGLKRSQQMFSDINGNHVKPSSAINMVYDHRNEFSRWVLGLLDEMPRVKARIEMESSSVGKKSSKLWSILAIKKTVMTLTGLTDKTFKRLAADDREEHKRSVRAFFEALDAYLPSWKAMIDYQIPAMEVRENLLVGHAVFLEALAMAAVIQNEHGADGQPWEGLKRLKDLNVTKAAQCWKGRCVVMGRMSKNAAAIKATAAQVCRHLEAPLPPELRQLDNEIEHAA